MRRAANISVLALLLAIFAVFLAIKSVFAMTSSNYRIIWDSINSGGLDMATSTNYRLRDTIGEQATGYSTSTNYTISAGYRAGDKHIPSLRFNIGTQENFSRTPYTEFSDSEEYVVVDDVTYFAAGDYVGVVENQGLGQLVAVGKVTSVVGNTVYVDNWEGNPGALSQFPAGGDDYCYRLGGFAASFGALSSTQPKTALTVTDVASDSQNGYTTYVNDDGDLTNGVSSIRNVSDGEVSLNSEEYGWQVFGSKAINTGSDLPFQAVDTAIQQSTLEALDDERSAFVYKIAIEPFTPDGNYSHHVFFTVTANF